MSGVGQFLQGRLPVLLFLLVRPTHPKLAASSRPRIDPMRIGNVRFMNGAQVTPDILFNQVPVGVIVQPENKTSYTAYLCVKFIPKRKNYQCGMYLPYLHTGYMDEGVSTPYHSSQLRVILAEPGSIEWVAATSSNKEAVTNSWFSCKGTSLPKGDEEVPCRTKWEKSLVPGYVHLAHNKCVITWGGAWKESDTYEYIRASITGQVIFHALFKGYQIDDGKGARDPCARVYCEKGSVCESGACKCKDRLCAEKHRCGGCKEGKCVESGTCKGMGQRCSAKGPEKCQCDDTACQSFYKGPESCAANAGGVVKMVATCCTKGNPSKPCQCTETPCG